MSTKKTIISIFSIYIALNSSISYGAKHTNEESNADHFYGDIHEGTISTGGYISISQWLGVRNNQFSYDVSPSVLYFITDSLSLGGTMSLWNDADESVIFGIGPAFKWIFVKSKRIGISTSGHIRIGITDATLRSVIGANLSTEYFATPSVSLGPTLRFNHYTGSRTSYQRIGLLINASVYF